MTVRSAWRSASQRTKRGLFRLQLAFGKVAPDGMSAAWNKDVRQLLKKIAHDPANPAIVDAAGREALETYAEFGRHIDDVLAHRKTLGPQSLKVEGAALKDEGKKAGISARSALSVVHEIRRRYKEDYIPRARDKFAASEDPRDAARLAELEARKKELEERSFLLVDLSMPTFRTGMLTDYAVKAPLSAVPDLSELAAFFQGKDKTPAEEPQKLPQPEAPAPDMGHEFRHGVEKEVVVGSPLKFKPFGKQA